MPAAQTLNCHYAAFATELDWMAVCWTDDQTLASVAFARPSREVAAAIVSRRLPPAWSLSRAAVADAPTPLRRLIERLQAFARGADDGDFRDVPLELSDRTPFQRRVLRQCQAIPPGETVSYGELARRAKAPRAARAVGNVMRVNRVPLVVPCHRVVASDGSLRGFSAPQGLRMKQRLLQLECHGDASDG